jgi:hypothetical protein
VARDQQFVSSPFAEHVPADDGSGYDDCVQTIHRDSLDWMQIFQGQTMLIRESHVPAHIANATAGFQTPDHIPLRQLLVFNTQLRVRVDTPLF